MVLIIEIKNIKKGMESNFGGLPSLVKTQMIKINFVLHPKQIRVNQC